MIPLPKAPKIIQKKGNTALFEIEALYPGYGVTVGNSLRRVLLSSLAGTAITQVKIKGVSHEFSTIPGVLEDVIIILLNLKKLRFKSFTNEPQTITLREKGIGEVKGKNFKLPPQVELANSEAHIATLTSKKTELNLEAQIEKGVGYSPVEEREQKKAEVGVIPVDAIFTPVKRVSFKVENMRVGKRTDFDRLKIEIETDGTLSPEEALRQASEILLGHFSLFSQEIGKAREKKKKEKGR
ncbi:DNA-directed RNA polymerase subunit alpha, partial [Patescibacteria group bacterium]|nr:DNA-directed RNA polymerase subunit alpha [Patescibacteria group bacterium]